MPGSLALCLLLPLVACWPSVVTGQLLNGPDDPLLMSEPLLSEDHPDALSGGWEQFLDGSSLIDGYTNFARQVAGESPISPVPRASQPQTSLPPASVSEPSGWDDFVEPNVCDGTQPCGPSCAGLNPGCLRLGFFSVPSPFGTNRRAKGRHRGIGQPLDRESWRYRPFSAGWFMGFLQGGPLIDDWVGQKNGFFGGYRFAWDYDHYWGCEMRFGFASVQLYDSQRAKNAQQIADAELGFDPTNPWLARFEQRRDSNVFLWDISILYYPWGDAAWRPYFLAGLGSAHIDFMDRLSFLHSKTVFAMPLAVGLKYRWDDWLALRFEVADNIAFGGGSGINTQHQISVTGGVEVRFGGTRKAYWPYNPGRHYW